MNEMLLVKTMDELYWYYYTPSTLAKNELSILNQSNRDYKQGMDYQDVGNELFSEILLLSLTEYHQYSVRERLL